MIGPALALYPTGNAAEHAKLTTFLTFVDGHKLPLDALSIHAYGASNWRAHLATTRRALKLGPASLRHTKIYLTEINTVDTSSSHSVQRASLDNYTIAASVLAMIAELNSAEDVAQVNRRHTQ